MNRIAKRTLWLVETLIVVIMITMVALTFADVIGRRLFGAPIYGANDITEHLMGLMVFAGLPVVTAGGAHLTVDLIGKFLDKPGMRWWRILTGLAVAVILGLIAWLFFKQADTARAIREVSQALNVPRAPLYLYISASAALSSLAALITAFTGPFRTESTQHTEEAL